MKENWTILWENSNNANPQGATFDLPYRLVSADFWHVKVEKETNQLSIRKQEQK